MDYQALFLTNDGRINRAPFLDRRHHSRRRQFGRQHYHSSRRSATDTIGQILVVLIALALVYPGINLGIKRFHDRDKSGWWVLIILVPIIGPIWYFIEAGCLRGTVGPNRFGPDPLG